MTTNPTASDDKLLRRESYIRRARYVALSLAVGNIVGFVAAANRVISEDPLPILVVAFFLLVYGYSCTVRLRHIQSIKYYREMLPSGQF